MEMLGRYELITPLSNKNAGSCQWCFGRYDGEEYFIKEFLEPKYPENDTVSSPEKIARKKKKCKKFEDFKWQAYRAINENSDGNAVRITEFFRVGSKYYMAMPKIESQGLKEAWEVANLPGYVRRRLCAVVAHAISCVHAAGYVHSDVKHSNVLITLTRANKLTAKVIDYDAGFFESDPHTNPEALSGDQPYFSPEAIKFQWGEEAKLTCKMDIFALGVLFHQYLTGDVPLYDKESYFCTGNAVACGSTVTVMPTLAPELQDLLQRMLAEDPDERPTAQEVHQVLIKPFMPADIPKPVPEPPKPKVPEPITDFVGDAPGKTGFQALGNWWE